MNSMCFSSKYYLTKFYTKSHRSEQHDVRYTVYLAHIQQKVCGHQLLFNRFGFPVIPVKTDLKSTAYIYIPENY